MHICILYSISIAIYNYIFNYIMTYIYVSQLYVIDNICIDTIEYTYIYIYYVL